MIVDITNACDSRCSWKRGDVRYTLYRVFLSDPDRGSDLELAIWQFFDVLLLVFLGMVRSELSCNTAVRPQGLPNPYIF